MDIIYTDKRDFTTGELQALFRSVDWRSANYPERLKKALDHCETVYTAWHFQLQLIPMRPGCQHHIPGIPKQFLYQSFTAGLQVFLLRPIPQEQYFQ